MVAFFPPLCNSCFRSNNPSISTGGKFSGNLCLSLKLVRFLILKLGVLFFLSSWAFVCSKCLCFGLTGGDNLSFFDNGLLLDSIICGGGADGKSGAFSFSFGVSCPGVGGGVTTPSPCRNTYAFCKSGGGRVICSPDFWVRKLIARFTSLEESLVFFKLDERIRFLTTFLSNSPLK